MSFRNPRARIAALSLLATLAVAVAAAAQEPGGFVSVPEDLLAVLTLRGKPCASVASWERLAESDYLVVCSDGHRYRVHVEGDRVEVEERPRTPR